MMGMYSMGPMGMMGGMNNMYNMYGSNNSGENVHQSFKSRYGIGQEDFGTRPFVRPCATPVIPKAPEPVIEKSWLGRFIRKCYM